MPQPLNIGMPESLDIGPGYTLRVTALAPTTGNLVSNVLVDTVLLTVSLVSGTVEALQTGQWFLVPGPGA